MATKPSRIVHVDDTMPGITRRRAGRGWAYYDPVGALIADRAERGRLNAIALPPAYSAAWFCPMPNGHLLATGVDARGRKQYRYHPEFRSWREAEKFDACHAFGLALPKLRKRVEEDLTQRGFTRERAIACVVRLLDLGALRIGNAAYARANRSYGATTLEHRHAEVHGQRIRLAFRGKSGKDREVALSDRALATFVRRLHDLPGQRLFQWRDPDGTCHDVTSACVNEYLSETMGEGFTAKHFRTFHASAKGLSLLAHAKEVLPIKAVIGEVAEHLGNTPAVTRKSYIHPAVIDLVARQEEWRATLEMPRTTRWLTREERALIALLEGAPAAEVLLANAA
ncbi:MAG: DNA topoisomerase [Sphingomonadales bacterium 32-64-17]|nr:MAG: DNA topoisomerase [Sphingomonadales bacterium 32-64-17]